MSMVIIQSVQGVDHLRTFSGEGRILRPRPSCWLRVFGYAVMVALDLHRGDPPGSLPSMQPDIKAWPLEG